MQINDGIADVGNLIQIFQTIDDHIPHDAGGHLSPSHALQGRFNFTKKAFDVSCRNRAFGARDSDTPGEFFAVKFLARAVALDDDKARGLDDFSEIPNGVPGIEHRMTLLYDAGVAGGRLSLERFVDVTAAAPARIFGLAPRKGAIAEGADADIVVFVPAGTTTISAATHHMRVDYNPYEGRTLRGAIDVVLARGEVVVSGNRYVGAPGRGRFLKRAPFGPGTA